MTGYYDLILGLIPLALLGITGVLTLAGIDFTTAVPVGATVSVALIGHAMFVRAPVDPEPAATQAAEPPTAQSAEPGD